MQQTLTETMRKLPLPGWLPLRVRRTLSGQQVSTELPRAVKLRLRKPEKMRVSEHAAKYSVVADGAHQGAWRHEYAPHGVKIMDTYGMPWVREVWFCAVEQAAKTAIMLNCMKWAIDCDPGNMFYLMPTEDTAKKVVGEKIRPGLKRSPRIARYLSAKQDDTSLTKISMRHGMSILPAWANSPSSMATFAAKHCFGDEIDKYPEMAGKETDPITLIKKRNRTYKGRYKRFFGSTPAGLYIYKGVQDCHQVWERRVKCPECGELIRMEAERLVIPAGATPESIEQTGVEYACTCGAPWDEAAREYAIRNARWVCIKGADIQRPAKVGFILRAWECLDIPMTEIAAAWLRAKEGDLAAKKAWANGYEAMDYVEEKVGQLSEGHVLKFRSELPRNLVPPDTARLALIVDTQQASFYYKVIAYGYAPEIRVQQIRHGIVETFADLEGLLAKSFRDHEKREFRIVSGVIDSGGTRKGYQKHSRTVEVYEWTSRNRVMLPLKGVHGRTGDMLSYKDIATYPGTNKKIPGGLKRVNVRVDVFKDDLERRLGYEPDDAQAMSYNMDIDEGFAKHYTGETKDEHGDWQHEKRSQRIDYWDCDVYSLAHREMIKLRVPRKEQQPVARRVYSKGVQHG
jgi:terminase, large subunit